MILCLGTTPAVQRVMVFAKLTLDAVNRATTTLDGASGKSVNVAKVLKSLGEQPMATGFLGGDRGAFVRRVLDDRGVESEFVTVTSPTRQCLTVIDEFTGTHTELVEESGPATAADFDALLAVVRRRIRECRALVMSGTIATGGPPDLYHQLTCLAHEAGALAVVDAQGRSLAETLAAQPDLVKPNRAELALTVGRALPDEADVRSAMCELQARGARRVVVTAGAGPVLAFDGREFWRIVPPPVPVANPIGSGDAFTAGLVARLVRGEALGAACRWGAAAGAANALTLLPGDLRREDVERMAGMVGLSLVGP
jgi:tagatose 6-phosphate kinase